MACCVFAAFLFAQCSLMLRRWGQFWGVVPKEQSQEIVTIYDKLGGWLKKPAGRVGLFSLLAFEAVGLSAWIYVDHGEHFVQISHEVFSSLRSYDVVYVSMCTADGSEKKIPVSLN